MRLSELSLSHVYSLLGRKRPKVFGLGLSKTGTTSLALALRRLGYSHTGYEADLLVDWSRGDYERINQRIERFECFEDWPYPLMYSQLMRKFGSDAYYILTVRKSAETWLESLKKHALRGSPDNARYRKIAYGFEYPQLDEPAHIARYNDHNAAVKRLAEELGLTARFRVLCWEHGDGWNELCELLGRRVPKADFPHANNAASIEMNEGVVAANQQRIAAASAATD